MKSLFISFILGLIAALVFFVFQALVADAIDREERFYQERLEMHLNKAPSSYSL